MKATQHRVRGVDRLQHEALVSARHGSNDKDEETENQSGSGDVISATPSNKSVASPPPGANHSLERSVPSRHQFKHQTPTIASLSKQKRQVIVEKEPRRSHPPPMDRRPIAGPSQLSSRPDSNREQKLRDAALKAQRRQELSTKYSYHSNLSSRPLLSPLMNPDSQIPPGSHPYKRVYSSDDVPASGRPLTGPARLGTQALTSVTSSGEVKGKLSLSAPLIVRKRTSSRVTRSSAPNGGSKGSDSTTARESRSSKSAAALLISDSVTASSSIGDSNGFDDRFTRKMRNNSLFVRRDPMFRQMLLEEDESEDERKPAILFSARDEFSNNAGLSNTSVGVSREPLTLPMHTSSNPSPEPTRSQSHHISNPHELVSTPPPMSAPLPLRSAYKRAARSNSPHTTRQPMSRAEITEEMRQNPVRPRKAVIERELESLGFRRSRSSALSPIVSQLLDASPTVRHAAETKLDVAPQESNAPIGTTGEVSAVPIANSFSVPQSSQSPHPIMNHDDERPEMSYIRPLCRNIPDDSEEDDGDSIVKISSDSSGPMEELEIDSGKQVESTRGLSWADPNLWQVWKEYRDRQNRQMGMKSLAV